MRIFFNGYYGFSNLGDEALLWTLLRAFEAQTGGTATFLVRSSHPVRVPPEIAARCSPVSQRIGDLLDSAEQADITVFGGGSQFQDHGHWRKLRNLIKPYWIARRANRLAGLGLSIGPLHTFTGRALTRRIVRRMQPLLVRDADSRAFAASCGVAAKLGSDIALAGHLHCPPASAVPNLRLALALLPAGALLHADPGADRAWTSSMRRALRDVSGQDANTVFVRAPFQRGIDEPCIRSALASVPAERQADARLAEGPEIALEDLNQCSHFIAMRLHALVFATLLRKPVLIISYHPKVRRLAEQLGYHERSILELEQLRDARLLAAAIADLVLNPAVFMPQCSVDEISRHVCAQLDACIETLVS